MLCIPNNSDIHLEIEMCWPNQFRKRRMLRHQTMINQLHKGKEKRWLVWRAANQHQQNNHNSKLHRKKRKKKIS